MQPERLFDDGLDIAEPLDVGHIYHSGCSDHLIQSNATLDDSNPAIKLSYFQWKVHVTFDF